MAFGFSVVANDTIRFTWEAGTTSMNLNMGATNGDTYTIYWGDETDNTYKGHGEGTSMLISHLYPYIGTYTVTIIGGQSCQILYLTFAHLGTITINNLDVTKSTNLQMLRVERSSLRCLDVSKNTALTNLGCYNNHLPLSDLFVVSEIISDQEQKWLGTQTLALQTACIGQVLFSDQSVFNGIYTNYEVTQNGNPAPTSNYAINNGTITFHTLGTYIITMTNNAIVSHTYYPAKVIAEINVSDVGIVEVEQTKTLYAYIQDGTIYLNGLTAGETWNVYNMLGMRVHQSIATDKIETWSATSLPSGVYIVRSGNKTLKIIKQ